MLKTDLQYRPTYAIVGAGPAGLYAAQQILLRLPEARVVVHEGDSEPFGLLERGVTPDHPGTKNLRRQFDRTLQDPRLSLRLNSPVRTDQLDELTQTSDAVVIATGAAAERVHPAAQQRPDRSTTGAEICARANGHDARPGKTWRPTRHVVIIGAGNVALDAARMVLRPDRYSSEVSHVHVVSRSAASQARFSASQLSELASQATVQVMHGAVLADHLKSAPVRHLTDADDRSFPGGAVTLHFETSVSWGPVAETAVLTSTRGTIDLPDASLVSAIGFTNQPSTGDVRRSALTEAITRRPPESPVHVVGWAFNGGQGNIATARSHAVSVAKTLVLQSTPV